jgi:acetate kinase
MDVFVASVRHYLGAYLLLLNGADAIVFTGGIGENAAPVRAAICRESRWLGIELDDAANMRGGPRISRPVARVCARVIPTNEELMIARHTIGVLAGAPPGAAPA